MCSSKKKIHIPSPLHPPAGVWRASGHRRRSPPGMRRRCRATWRRSGTARPSAGTAPRTSGWCRTWPAAAAPSPPRPSQTLRGTGEQCVSQALWAKINELYAAEYAFICFWLLSSRGGHSITITHDFDRYNSITLEVIVIDCPKLGLWYRYFNNDNQSITLNTKSYLPERLQ